MKVQVFVIISMLVIIAHVHAAVTVPERTDVSNKSGKGRFFSMWKVFFPLHLKILLMWC